MNALFEKTGINIPEIYLPDMEKFEKWAVIACDQYTSQPSYWEDVCGIVKDEPSALKLVLPEIYLEHEGFEKKINEINNTMALYEKEKMVKSIGNAFVFIERTLTSGKVREGLLTLIDLEKYDYKKGSKSLIRATECTVAERIPPREKIREKAVFELPHVMLLMDDPENTVFQIIYEKKNDLGVLYDFELMKNSGRLKGYKISDDILINKIAQSFNNLLEKIFEKTGEKFLFAVGDGNHSLASAKSHWEKIKINLSQEEQRSHPARFSLVEIVNLHSDALNFEPIHRLLKNVDAKNFYNEIYEFSAKSGIDLEIKFFEWDKAPAAEKGRQVLNFISPQYCGALYIKNSPKVLAADTVTMFIDKYLENHMDIKIDYIHGDKTLKELASVDGNLGIALPAIKKSDLFEAVVKSGVLPKKTFSMGDADDKRFYLEMRKII